MPFSLKLQGNNQQNASTMNSTKGKAGEKAVCSQCCGDETTTYYDRAKNIQGYAQAKEFFLYSGKDGNRDSIRPKVFGGGGMGGREEETFLQIMYVLS